MKDKVNTIVIATLAGAVGALGVGVISGAGADNASSAEPVVVRIDQPQAADAGPTECPAEGADVGAADAADTDTAPSSTSTANSASTAGADAASTGNETEVIVENFNENVSINDNDNANANSNDSDNTNNNTLTSTQTQTVNQTVDLVPAP